MTRDGSRSGVIVVGLLSVAVAAVIVKVMFDLAPPGERPFQFWFALGFIFFLELLAAGLLLLPQLAAGRRELFAALYPSIGLVTLLYVGVGLLASLLLFRAGGIFFTAVVLLSLLYLGVMGALVTLYGHSSAGVAGRSAERHATFEFSRRAEEVYQKFVAQSGRFEVQQYRPVEATMRRLAEAFRFALPFGRPGTAGAAVTIEAEIQAGLHELWELVDRSAQAGASELPQLLGQINVQAAQLLGAMERRDRSLVR